MIHVNFWILKTLKNNNDTKFESDRKVLSSAVRRGECFGLFMEHLDAACWRQGEIKFAYLMTNHSSLMDLCNLAISGRLQQ